MTSLPLERSARSSSPSTLRATLAGLRAVWSDARAHAAPRAAHSAARAPDVLARDLASRVRAALAPLVCAAVQRALGSESLLGAFQLCRERPEAWSELECLRSEWPRLPRPPQSSESALHLARRLFDAWRATGVSAQAELHLRVRLSCAQFGPRRALRQLAVGLRDKGSPAWIAACADAAACWLDLRRVPRARRVLLPLGQALQSGRLRHAWCARVHVWTCLLDGDVEAARRVRRRLEQDARCGELGQCWPYDGDARFCLPAPLVRLRQELPAWADLLPESSWEVRQGDDAPIARAPLRRGGEQFDASLRRACIDVGASRLSCFRTDEEGRAEFLFGCTPRSSSARARERRRPRALSAAERLALYTGREIAQHTTLDSAAAPLAARSRARLRATLILPLCVPAHEADGPSGSRCAPHWMEVQLAHHLLPAPQARVHLAAVCAQHA